MIDANFLTNPRKRDLFALRLIIIIALLTIFNFFFWFLQPELIENPFLFWLLTSVILFDSLRIIYIWYHYWDVSVPVKPISDKQFTVDILTTYFPGEPYDMIVETLLAIKKINYPHTAYLCDEANDAYLKDFCNNNGIIHVTRDNRINAKAGNINNALQQATGEICLILDPDHVPLSNFLDEVIPYFEDENIGFVQTAQVYYNVEESSVAKGAAQQTFHFYGPLMMCMNSYGTVNAIGANCVFRRKALDSIGGHAPGLSEDMHTAMQLHAKGWKSIYVPQAFTKGLVPASLTAYYKQQLKWSRGTLELLVSVYPKLFKNFTWRQKIHYGILPMHYLSGIFFLIGFLVPIISLFNASLPWKGNIINFGLIYMPMFISIIGIRLYIQRWVIHKSERGLHILGGLLMICSWWVLLIGFIYTVIRKNVPYLPTPKNDKELTNFKLLIPNLVIAILSIVAAIYGLSVDYTPFSLFMAGFALMNAFFMFYTLVFAYEKPPLENIKFDENHKLYTKTIRNSAFNFFNKLALPIILFSIFICGSLLYYREYIKWTGVSPIVKEKNIINYLGIYAPSSDNGLTDFNEIKKTLNNTDENFDLISIYISWDANTESNFPRTLVDSIFEQKSIPFITWEPWLNTFESDKSIEGKHVYDLIVEGYFDNFMANFADDLKSYNRPVFLRFAHEFDNPFYPWYVEGEDAATKFKTAWIHTYEIFRKRGANNIVWIWNPWKSENMVSYYPGESYLDWIGVNILNYGEFNEDRTGHDFKSLYQPFHDELKNLPLTPVIISEFGSLKSSHQEKDQKDWLDEAFEVMADDYPEIKSIIYFNSKYDNNWPEGERHNEYLDWSVASKQLTETSFANKEVPSYVFQPLANLKTHDTQFIKKNNTLENIKGINYKKGHNWKSDYYVLNRNNLIDDFQKLKTLGVNTIKYQLNSTYDYNVLMISEMFEMDVSLSFWIPEDVDFMIDTLKTQSLKFEILKKVKSLKENKHIISWNIENDVQYNQKNFFHKPELLYQNKAYLLWLKSLVEEIKILDPNRPLVVDVEINKQSIFHINRIISNINGIDAIGIVVKEDGYLDEVLNHIKKSGKNFVLREIGTDNFVKHENSIQNEPFYITSWQDKHESNKLDFYGLVDRKGRYKEDYYTLHSKLAKTNYKAVFPKFKILKPSKLIFDNTPYTYRAMFYDDSKGWTFATDNDGFKFEWSLIKCDDYGNYLAVKDVGFNATLNLTAPEKNENYKLLLTIIKGDKITTSLTSLKTPVLNK